jgi:hypothetical protein
MKRIKVAMLVVDSNDVSGASNPDFSRPSPICHPAIEALLDGLSTCPEVECHVLYGNHHIAVPEFRRVGSLVYTALPYKPWLISAS